MAKLTIDQLLKSRDLMLASELKAQKKINAELCKAFEDAAIEQARNQRFQIPKQVGSITRPFKRESFED